MPYELIELLYGVMHTRDARGHDCQHQHQETRSHGNRFASDLKVINLAGTQSGKPKPGTEHALLSWKTWCLLVFFILLVCIPYRVPNGLLKLPFFILNGLPPSPPPFWGASSDRRQFSISLHFLYPHSILTKPLIVCKIWNIIWPRYVRLITIITMPCQTTQGRAKGLIFGPGFVDDGVDGGKSSRTCTSHCANPRHDDSPR